MVNRKISKPEDNLVLVNYHIFRSQKSFMDGLSRSTGKSASSVIRDMIAAQMDGHEAEISKLKEEKRQHEAALNIIDAQIKELEAETNRQQNTIALRENLFNQQVDELVHILIGDGGFIQELDRPIKFRVQGMNLKINGSGVQPFTVEELKQAVIEKAKAEGVRIYGC